MYLSLTSARWMHELNSKCVYDKRLEERYRERLRGADEREEIKEKKMKIVVYPHYGQIRTNTCTPQFSSMKSGAIILMFQSMSSFASSSSIRAYMVATLPSWGKIIISVRMVCKCVCVCVRLCICNIYTEHIKICRYIIDTHTVASHAYNSICAKQNINKSKNQPHLFQMVMRLWLNEN